MLRLLRRSLVGRAAAKAFRSVFPPPAIGQEQPASWYDDVYKESTIYSVDVEDAVWATLWRQAASHVPPNSRVVDIGCGPGHFPTLLKGLNLESYVGYDFSATGIQQAKQRVPWAEFHCSDVLQMDQLPDADIYVFLETLEHVTQDLEMLQKVPVGKRVIITVPTFDDTAHVRFYPKLKQAVDRFSPLINIEHADSIERWHLIVGTSITPEGTKG